MGIPLGSDPAPFMAKHFLLHYKNNCIQKTKRKDLTQAICNMFQFINDHTAINDGA